MSALVAASLRRASASARHFVWTLGLLSALAAPALSVALPKWELPLVRVRAAAPVSTASLPSAVGSERTARRRECVHRDAGKTASPAAEDAATRITTTGGATIPWRAIVFFAWFAGAAAILGRMFLGLAAVLWMSRRTPAVTDAPWLAQAQSLAGGARALARPLPADRRVHDADGVGNLPPVGADAGRRRHLAVASPPRGAAARARAREAPRLPDSPRRADRLRGLLVQPAGLDGGAAPAHRARACLRRSRARLGDARLRLRRPAARHRPRDARRPFPGRPGRGEPGDGAALAARGPADGDSRSKRAAPRTDPVARAGRRAPSSRC